MENIARNLEPAPEGSPHARKLELSSEELAQEEEAYLKLQMFPPEKTKLLNFITKFGARTVSALEEAEKQ